jgi:hypothetical protein
MGNLAFGEQTPEAKQADYVVMVVLEGIGNNAIQSGTLPTLARLAREGAVTWTAESVSPPLTVPAMASLLTGLPVKKHRVNQDWERYDFARSFLRSPTVFDYMDLAGGKDSAVFFMDERLYQLSRPEIYVDSQICGTAKPNCTPNTVAIYIQDYLKKVTSEGGYGFRLFRIPDLLLVHMPTASNSGRKYGWDSKAYQEAMLAVDTAVENILNTYRELDALERTMVLITGLNGEYHKPIGSNGTKDTQPNLSGTVPWFAWGINVKSGYRITRQISLMDTGATILYALGLQTHTEWESHAVDEIFQMVPERRTTEN